MPNKLDKARILARSFRYTWDKGRGEDGLTPLPKLNSVKELFYKEGLKISEGSTPLIGKKIREVCDRLLIPEKSVEAFVFASPEIQASCFSTGQSECVLRFSSSLLELLDEDEIGFVVGHEVGHFLLGHSPSPNQENTSLENYLQARAQEISADRIGLIACGSIDVAAKALIKTVSGLSSKHLKYNISEFISQLKQIQDLKNTAVVDASHPPMLLRCRSLLWFSMSRNMSEYPNFYEKNELETIDRRVRADLEKDADGLIKDVIAERILDFKIWTAALEIVQRGSFSKEHQVRLASALNNDLVLRLKGYLSNLNSNDAEAEVRQRLRDSENQWKAIAPSSFNTQSTEIRNQIIGLF